MNQRHAAQTPSLYARICYSKPATQANVKPKSTAMSKENAHMGCLSETKWTMALPRCEDCGGKAGCIGDKMCLRRW